MFEKTRHGERDNKREKTNQQERAMKKHYIGDNMNYYIAYGIRDVIIWGVFARNTDEARRFISDDLKTWGYHDLLADWTAAGRHVRMEEPGRAAA